MEYIAQAVSPIVNGEVKLSINENSFTATSLFNVTEISFINVNAIDFKDYTITVKSIYGDFAFSRMGQWAQPFFSTLYEAYNKAVLRAFFVSGEPFLKTEGVFSFTENNVTVNMNSKVPIYVYEKCIITLPPNDRGRRIPLCFIVDIDKGDFKLTLELCTGEKYCFSKLGQDMVFFVTAVEKQLRFLREKSLAVIKEFDSSLTATQASQIAKLMPEGVAVSMEQLVAISPSFVETLESKLVSPRMVDSYKVFKELCDPMQICVGFKKNNQRLDSARKADGLSTAYDKLGGRTSGGNLHEPSDDVVGDAVSADGETATSLISEPYLFWIIAPSPDRRYVAVEFLVKLGESAATFVYRIDDDFSKSVALLNQALETISFRREVIRLTDEELLEPKNVDYHMSVKRTTLRFIRKKLVGRVIHLSAESWKRKLTELWRVDNSTQVQA